MRFLILFAHPQQNSFQASLHRAAVETLRSGGHEVDDCDLYAEGFQPVLSESELNNYHDTEINLISVDAYVDRLRTAEGLVFIFPTWWYGLPAILKGYMDRVWLPGICFEIVNGKTYPLLQAIKTLVIITTYGSPYWLNNFYVGNPIYKFFKRGIGRLISPKAKILWLAKYHMDAATSHDKAKFLSAVRKTLSKL
jgi:NAD(P)H dehydrogenase (quinone)